MSLDDVIPQDEVRLRQFIIAECAKHRRGWQLRAALERYDEYVRSCRPISPETHAAAAGLWRRLKIENRLLNAYWGVEGSKGAYPDLRADVHREARLFYAQLGEPKLAERYEAGIQAHRKDRSRIIVDTTADARCALYAKRYTDALLIVTSVDSMLQHVSQLNHLDAKDNSWWTFVIAVHAGDYEHAYMALDWLTTGRYAQRQFIAPELKSPRRRVANTYRLLDHLPVKSRRRSQLQLIRAALSYD